MDKAAWRCSCLFVPYCIHKTSIESSIMFQFFFPSFLCVFDSKLPTTLDEDKIIPFFPLLSYSLSPSEFRILSFLPWSSCKERPPSQDFPSTLLLSFNQLHPRSITSMAPHYQQQNSIMCSWSGLCD